MVFVRSDRGSWRVVIHVVRGVSVEVSLLRHRSTVKETKGEQLPSFVLKNLAENVFFEVTHDRATVVRAV